MIQDPKLMLAVSQILQRSEKQLDTEKLIDTFVDLGIIAQLHNRNNQIIYGRRGTGKTHVFKVLASRIEKISQSDLAVYIDARTLGSSSQFADQQIPMQQRVVALLRDVLSEIYNKLLEAIIYRGGSNAVRALQSLDRMQGSISEPSTSLQEEKITGSASSAQSNSSSASLGARSAINASLSASSTRSRSGSVAVEQKYVSSGVDKIIFPSISSPLMETLGFLEAHLFLLIDEWSSLPADIQPYLAEFLKHTILPLKETTLKIAALEYRSHFSIKLGNDLLGFEVGADISTAPDLDDYFVFDRNPNFITDSYCDILLRHISAELDPDYLKSRYEIVLPQDIASKLFTQRPTMKELARACEGVIRDLINIFTKAYFHAQRRGRDTIDQQAVTESSREWFEQDKSRSLEPEMNTALRLIVGDVIGNRRARSFLLLREHERHPLIQKLFGARVIHLVRRGYADKDNPGIRYNIYSLDYGTYVDLIGTSKQPQIDYSVGSDQANSIVPFDDNRSIRRIILDPAILDNL